MPSRQTTAGSSGRSIDREAMFQFFFVLVGFDVIFGGGGGVCESSRLTLTLALVLEFVSASALVGWNGRPFSEIPKSLTSLQSETALTSCVRPRA